jgi:hypothetical protein
MKKLLFCLAFFATSSCGPANLLDPISNNCEKVTENYLKAIEEWSKDMESKSKCEAVKKSLNDLLKSCSVYTAVQRKIYEEQLKEFTCE